MSKALENNTCIRDELFSALEEQDNNPKVIEILERKPLNQIYLNQKKTLLNGATRTPYDSLLQEKNSELVEQLFEKNLILENTISDEQLYEIIRWGFNGNENIMNVVIKYISKERWRNVIFPNEGNPYTIFSAIFEHTPEPSTLTRYFLDCGVDPRIGNVLLYCDDVESIQMMLNRYPDLDYNVTCDYDHHGTMIMKLLYNNKNSKKFEWLKNVKDIIQIALNHNYDLQFKDRYEYTVYDYIVTYNWIDYLSDVIQIPENYEARKVVYQKDFNWGDDELDENNFPHFNLFNENNINLNLIKDSEFYLHGIDQDEQNLILNEIMEFMKYINTLDEYCKDTDTINNVSERMLNMVKNYHRRTLLIISKNVKLYEYCYWGSELDKYMNNAN